MHRAASTVVAWTSRLMIGHDMTRMGIDDTGLGDWNPRREDRETGTIMKQENGESNTWEGGGSEEDFT